MTREKLDEFRKRMLNHKVVNDIAIVEITAKELQDMLDLIEYFMDRISEEVIKNMRDHLSSKTR